MRTVFLIFRYRPAAFFPLSLSVTYTPAAAKKKASTLAVSFSCLHAAPFYNRYFQLFTWI
jgi:hypothetical protein